MNTTKKFVHCQKHGRQNVTPMLCEIVTDGVASTGQQVCFQEAARCPMCEGGRHLEVITFTHEVVSHPSKCSKTCQNAWGTYCSCSCGGERHGIGRFR